MITSYFRRRPGRKRLGRNTTKQTLLMKLVVELVVEQVVVELVVELEEKVERIAVSTAPSQMFLPM
jgi:hypothetical protein